MKVTIVKFIVETEIRANPRSLLPFSMAFRPPVCLVPTCIMKRMGEAAAAAAAAAADVSNLDGDSVTTTEMTAVQAGAAAAAAVAAAAEAEARVHPGAGVPAGYGK